MFADSCVRTTLLRLRQTGDPKRVVSSPVHKLMLRVMGVKRGEEKGEEQLSTHRPQGPHLYSSEATD